MKMIPLTPQRGGVRAVGTIGLAIRLALITFALCLGAPPAQAGAPCGEATAPSCNGGCPVGSVCRLQGDTCTCLASCGDFAACDAPDCPAGFACTNIGTAPCVCVPLATPTPTITPTASPTSPNFAAPVPATSTNGLIIALLLLGVVGVVALNWRNGGSASR